MSRAERESMIERNVNGVPVIMTEFGYKTFSMVVKSIGYFTRRTSPTYYRTEGVMETWHGQPQVTPQYPQPSANYIMDLYRQWAPDYKTLVIGPGLEICCYLGRVLNVPILPSQFIASCPNRESAEQNQNPNNLYILGHEMDWGPLCVWIKPLNLGELYAEMIDKADTIIMFSINSGPQNHLGTCRGWVKNNISILDSHTAGPEFSWLMQEPEKAGYYPMHDKIPHWEFAMDVMQIINLEKYCMARGKHTIVISSGDWCGFIPLLLFKKFYEKNGLRPTGITHHAYWSCHPFYESEFLRIPMVSFEYGAPGYVRFYREVIDSINFSEKNSEFITWDGDYNRTSAPNPAKHCESWGFPVRYRTDRPYDIWCYGWEKEEDLINPTREWIVPQLRGKMHFREFDYLSPNEVLNIVEPINKVEINVR